MNRLPNYVPGLPPPPPKLQGGPDVKAGNLPLRPVNRGRRPRACRASRDQQRDATGEADGSRSGSRAAARSRITPPTASRRSRSCSRVFAQCARFGVMGQREVPLGTLHLDLAVR